MTAGEQGKSNAAAAWFAGILTLALGGAGLIIAALAVGTERALSGGKAEYARNAGNRGSWFDNQQAWLDMDRGRRAQALKARNDWLTSGGDKASKPAGPSVWARMGIGMRRAGAHIALAGRDFKNGFTDTTRAGKDAWRQGGTFQELVKTRPEAPARTNEWTCPGCGTPMSETRDRTYAMAGLFCVACQPSRLDADEWLTPDPDEGQSCPPDAEQIAQADAAKTAEEREFRRAFPDYTSATDPDTETPAIAGVDPTTEQGDTMTGATTAPQQTTAPQGDTNLDQTTHDLVAIKAKLAKVGDLNDQLSTERADLLGMVAAAKERVQVTGGTAATVQALDAAEAVCARIDQNLAGVADATIEAADQTEAADRGLDPARHAQDALHQSGAQGEFVSAASN